MPCCREAHASKNSHSGAEQESLQGGKVLEARKDESERSESEAKFIEVFPIRRFNSSDSVTTCETGSSGSIRKFGSCEQLRSPDRFAGGYNRARVTEINDEEDEIDEPVFVDIPTLVAVLIKPDDDSLHESSARIEEICSDEVQEGSIDAHFIETGNDEYEEPTAKLDDRDSERGNSTDSCNNVPDVDREIDEVQGERGVSSERTASPSIAARSAGRGRSRGRFSKQNSIDDLSSCNLNVSRKFGSIEAISKSKEPSVGLQRSQTNLEKRPVLADRGKKLNNIREIDDRGKGRSGKSGIWRATGNLGSKDLHLQRKSSNESDKSLKDSNSGKATGYGIVRKPSLENLRRKTSKDSSSSSSKEEQILVSSLAGGDKLLGRKDSFDHETTTASGPKHHTAIQRVKRAEIVAAVTERLYSSRKHTEESNMANNSASGTRSPPPEGTDVKITGNTGNTGSSGLTARSRLQEISRRMLLRRRRINVDTQTEETASTLRLRDAASLTDEPRVMLRDAAVLTDDHADCAVRNAPDALSDRRLPVLRVKDAATLTDRRPPTDVLRCKDAESLTDFDLDFDYAESDPSSAHVSRQRFCHPEMAIGRRTTCTDSSTNTFVTPATDSAAQTTRPRVTVDRSRETNSESGCCSRCCKHLTREADRRAPASSPEKNVVSISLPDMISITIESTNALESRIAAMVGTDVPIEARPRLVLNDKESQTDEHVGSEAEESSLTDLAFGSTQATQADGRVFRIENIFEDPKSKTGHEARREAATRKSVNLRNSLGTCSLIGIMETGTEIEWDGSRAEDAYHVGKRAIPKGGLTRAFIAKRRGCSFSPRRPAHRLVRHDLWKNWTVPGAGPPGPVEPRTAFRPSVLRRSNTDLAPIDHRSSRTSGECTSADKTANEPTRGSSGGRARSSRKTKVAATKDPLEHDHSFTDDSLDDNEDDDVARKSTERASSRDGENHEGPCPPDVVAHTKRKASKSANHVANVEASMDDDLDDTEVELPRTKKSAQVSIGQPGMREDEARIPGMSSYVNGNLSEDETNVTTTLSDKKKVSFSDLGSAGETNDLSNVLNRKIVAPEEDPAMALKSIVKKMMKPTVTESLDIVRPNNVQLEQSVQRGRIESTKNDRASSAKTRDSDDSKTEFPNQDRSGESRGTERNAGNETCSTTCSTCSMPKRNILEVYLNEATTFMRNVNSINEYVSATSVLRGSCGKRRRKRGARRGNDPVANKDRTEPRGCRTRDDPQSGSGQNGAIESYDKCLRSIERLEACIGKVGRHDQVLRDRYGIDVESAGAKSNLACSSVDSRTSVAIDDGAIRRKRGDGAIAGIDLEDSHDEPTSGVLPASPPLSSTRRTDDARRFTPRDTDDGSNNDEDDLERSIFRQLMGAADSTCRHWKTRQRGFFRRSELGSPSPTTYSKFRRQTFRRDSRGGILDLDRVPAVEDYLEDIRGGMESGSDPTKETGENADSRISSVVRSVGDAERRFRDRPLRKNDDPSEMEKVPGEPAILETRMEYLGLADPTSRTCFEERDAPRDTHGSKNGSRIEWTNLRRCGGPLELKYPGSPRAKFLQLLSERRRIVEDSRGANARDFTNAYKL